MYRLAVGVVAHNSVALLTFLQESLVVQVSLLQLNRSLFAARRPRRLAGSYDCCIPGPKMRARLCHVKKQQQICIDIDGRNLSQPQSQTNYWRGSRRLAELAQISPRHCNYERILSRATTTTTKGQSKEEKMAFSQSSIQRAVYSY